MKKAAFVDRDGFINRGAASGEYILQSDGFRLLPGAAHAVGVLNSRDFLVIVITNQACVGRGLITQEDLDHIHDKMIKDVFAASPRTPNGGYKRALIHHVYSCTHRKEEGCPCRKPKPGMILQAAAEFNIDLSQSWMWGDRATDVEAGKAAGCKTGFLTLDSKHPEEANICGADVVAATFEEILQYMV